MGRAVLKGVDKFENRGYTRDLTKEALHEGRGLDLKRVCFPVFTGKKRSLAR
jgi:hypothetical protein